jgi:hypothetical protein
MRKFLLAPIITVVMVATVAFGASFFMKPESAKAEPVAQQACDSLVDQILCVRVENGEVVVVNLLTNTVVVRQPLPKVTVSGPTITASLPRVTATRPPVTVTLPRVTNGTVTLPRRTVTIELPRATETVTLQGQTTTVSAQTVTTVVPITVTGANGQPIQTSVTITPSPQTASVTTKPVVKEREVRVSVPTAIGIGVGVLLLGLILGLLAIYVAYAVGYKDSEDAERTKWQKFRDELFGRKDEGEN